MFFAWFELMKKVGRYRYDGQYGVGIRQANTYNWL